MAGALFPTGGGFTRACLWLLQRPATAHIKEGVWALVCMVALEAMECGRRELWAGLHNMKRAAPRAAVNGALLAEQASRGALARFWYLLLDFVSLNVVPTSWVGKVAADAPFIGLVADGAGWRLKLNSPAGVELPAEL